MVDIPALDQVVAELRAQRSEGLTKRLVGAFVARHIEDLFGQLEDVTTVRAVLSQLQFEPGALGLATLIQFFLTTIGRFEEQKGAPGKFIFEGYHDPSCTQVRLLRLPDHINEYLSAHQA